MDKTIALMSLLLPQPIFGGLIYYSMNKLLKYLGLEDTVLMVAAVIATLVLFAIFCFFFARGFLASDQAKKLGF